jgi:hypothetical protein
MSTAWRCLNVNLGKDVIRLVVIITPHRLVSPFTWQSRAAGHRKNRLVEPDLRIFFVFSGKSAISKYGARDRVCGPSKRPLEHRGLRGTFSDLALNVRRQMPRWSKSSIVHQKSLPGAVVNRLI